MYSLRAAQEEHNKLLLSYERAIKEKNAFVTRVMKEKDALVDRIAKEKDALFERVTKEKEALQHAKDLIEAALR